MVNWSRSDLVNGGVVNWGTDGVNWGVVNWSVYCVDGSCNGNLFHGWSLSINNSVKSVDSVCGIGNSSDGTIGLDKRVLTLHNISVPGLGVGMVVTREGIVDSISKVVLWMGVVWFSSDWHFSDGDWCRVNGLERWLGVNGVNGWSIGGSDSRRVRWSCKTGRISPVHWGSSVSKGR